MSSFYLNQMKRGKESVYFGYLLLQKAKLLFFGKKVASPFYFILHLLAFIGYNDYQKEVLCLVRSKLITTPQTSKKVDYTLES